MSRTRHYAEALLSGAATVPANRGRYLVALWVLGCLALAVATLFGYLLNLTANTIAFVYLIVIVFLSLLDSFASSVIFSVFALGCLDYIFVEPRFTFQVEYSEDLLQIVAFVATSFIVTGLVRRMRALAGAHREQAQLLDLTHDSIFVRDVNDKITYWNRGAEELYGWTAEETAGRTTHDLLQTKFPVPLAEITEILLRTGRWEGELQHTRRDGTEIVVASRWSLQRDASGRPTGALETNTDITERRRTEEILRQSQATYLAEAQRLSATGSFGWNVATGELFWSEETFRIFGYDADLTPSLSAVFERVHPDDSGLLRDVVEHAASQGREFDVEHRLLMPDGGVKHLRIVARTVSYEPGSLQFVGAVMDVTAAKRAQELLHQAQSELAYVTRVTTLGELTASIAHEVNQPLAAITTNGNAALRFLGRDPPQIEEVRGALQRIVGDGKRAGEIVQRVRALTKKADLRTARIDLNSLVSEAVSLVQHELTSHRVTLKTELAPDLSAVLGDGVQLQQVLINLIINGIQAMDAVGDGARELVIRTGRGEDDRMVVGVEDSGAGIAPEIQSRLFDAFCTTKPNGMGMGLSICRTIIEAHSGRIWASSNPGRGANFQFALPAHREGTA